MWGADRKCLLLIYISLIRWNGRVQLSNLLLTFLWFCSYSGQRWNWMLKVWFQALSFALISHPSILKHASPLITTQQPNRFPESNPPTQTKRKRNIPLKRKDTTEEYSERERENAIQVWAIPVILSSSRVLSIHDYWCSFFVFGILFWVFHFFFFYFFGPDEETFQKATTTWQEPD